MKRINYLFAAGLAIAALASCQKELAEEVAVNGSDKNKEGWVELSFAVDMEKTALDAEGNVSWTEGDEVAVIYGTGADEFTKGTLSGNYVVATVPPEATKFYAVYPYGETYSVDADGKLSVTLPSTVDGTWAQANYIAAVSSVEDLTFNFKSICGVLKFDVTKKTSYIKIRPNVHKAVAGAFTFSFGADGIPTDFATSSTTYEVQASPADSLVAGTYYVPVLANTTLESGFGIRQSINGTLTGALSVAPLEVGRGSIVPLGSVQNNIRTKYYVKETAAGKGDGSDWDNAADAKLIVKLLSPYIYNSSYERLSGNPQYSGYTNAWRIHQSTVYVAAGTYDLKDGSAVSLDWSFKTDVNFTVKGGYPASATGTSLDGRDVDANVTTLTSSATGSNARLFATKGCYLRHFTFDGLYFISPSGTGRGTVIYQNASGSTNTMNNDKALLEFSNCRFKDQEFAQYGMIDINNRWSKALFEDCIFENLTTTSDGNGGAGIVVEGCKTIDIKNCVFKGNKTTNSTGGAIYLKLNDEAKNAVSKINITGCTFENNSAPATVTGATTGRGGAIHILGQTTKLPVVNISKCTFKTNTAKCAGGAIGFDYCTLTIDDCDFIGNSCESIYKGTSKGANFGGGAITGIYSDGSSNSIKSYSGCGTITIKNSSFDENTSYGRGGCLHFGTQTVYIDNCDFLLNYGGSKTNGGGAIFCNATQSYISNCNFNGNYTGSQAGGAICVKSTKANTYLYNNVFTGNYSANDGNALAGFDDGSQTEMGMKFYLYGNTFYKNGNNARASINCPPHATMYLFNNTVCESTTTSKGALAYDGGVNDVVTLYNNIIFNSNGNSIGAGKASTMVSAGKNIFDALTNVTLTEPMDDVPDVDVDDVFPSPSLTNGKLAWSGTVAGLDGYAAAADVKAAIQTASPTFYKWLNDNNYWLAGTSWWPGAYQPE